MPGLFRLFVMTLAMLICLNFSCGNSQCEAADNLTECSNYIEKENGPTALQYCQKAYDENPNSSEVYYWRGGAYILLNRYEEAVRDYTRFISMVPNEALAYKNRAVAYRGKGELLSALQDANKALEMEPKLYEAWVVRSMVHYMLGKNRQAFEDINTALAIAPDKEPAYTARGHMYNWIKYEHQLAASDFVTGLRLNPSSYQVRAFRAEHAYFFLHNSVLAGEELKNATLLRPQGEWIYLVTAEIYRELGQFATALNAVNYAIKLSPSSWMAYIHRALIFYVQGDSKTALADINTALTLAPDSVMALYLRSRLNVDRRLFDEVAADCLKVVSLSEGQYWYIYNSIGDIFVLKNDRQKAANAYREYLRIAPPGDFLAPEVKKKLLNLEQ